MSSATEQNTRATDVSQLAINTIRFLSVDAVEKANSGHPGTPMALAPVAYTLYRHVMNHNPKDPHWPNRDRFVLSAGHASMLLYSMLYLTGYGLTLDDIKAFRQWRSHTPGHPEVTEAKGVETTTGPLGQGIATAVGMAIAQRYLNGLFTAEGEKPLLDHRIYGIASDGDIMEGVSSEAASLAGHLGLSQLIFFYDDNKITIEGHTDLALSENTADRYRAYNWNVLKVDDGNDLSSIQNALKEAQRETARPTLIVLRTHIGFGSPNKVDSHEAHGAALGPEEVKLTKQNLGWPLEPTFHVPPEAYAHMQEAIAKGEAAQQEWKARFDAWAAKHPEKAAEWKRMAEGRLPQGWEAKLPDFQDEDKIATRAASGKVLNALAPIMPEIVGGSADLASSNNTMIKGAPDFSKSVAGRNLRFGVREHAMAAALNGMALSRMLIPYGGTFFIFTDYMKGGMRISALSELKVVYVLTHDSIGLGEDGPTHQPIEQLAHFRALPNTVTIRPADAVETAAAWKFALTHKKGPVLLVLTRQNLPVLKKAKYPAAGQVEKGGYVLSDARGGTPKVILIATGSEVTLTLGAQEKLEAEGIPTRVVSLPSWELFSAQTPAYRESVLPKAIKKRLAVEALSTFGWERWTGDEGDVIGMTTFGSSAPATVSFEKLGFSVANVVERAKKLL